MHKSKVMVLGATGQVGRLICDYLKQDDAIELVVTTRKKESVSQLSKTYGKAVYIDLDDPRTFSEALHGVERLFLLTGYSVSMLAQSKTLIDAAVSAGVKHIVHLGVYSKAWNCTAPHFAWHQMIEVYIKNTALKWTFLHPNCFLQNLTAFSVLSQNKLRWYTDKPCGWIALEDVAESAAKILKEGPDQHHAKEYWFSTESFDIYQIAEILSEILGTKIITNLRPSDAFVEDLGMDPKTIDPYFFSVGETCIQIEDGRMSYIGEVKDDVQILLGRKGLSLRQWVEMHKEKFIGIVNAKESGNLNWGKVE
jgi:NAD(P)H dehydrogenase (quinone)